MKEIRVAAKAPYLVRIERGLLQRVGALAAEVLPKPACKVALMADDTVSKLYGDAVQQSLQAAGYQVARHSFPAGEAYKTLTTWQNLLLFLTENQFTRTDAVVALGGGVTGDMAGFAAASYFRGIPWIQVPTTLLAMVDSSVGGKTGVNLPRGKNLVGAFHQPAAVLVDPDTLDTLPPELLLDGISEAIKTGMVGDQTLFEQMAAGTSPEQVEEAIFRCVAAKARLVELDEEDQGNRRLLNFGHSFGHAIEQCSGYQISHGKAVAMGMMIITRLAVRLGLCQASVRKRLQEALQLNGLPTASPYGAQALLLALQWDKKRVGENIVLILPKKIGHCISDSISWETLAAELPALLKE